jgi:hypothetical protein
MLPAVSRAFEYYYGFTRLFVAVPDNKGPEMPTATLFLEVTVGAPDANGPEVPSGQLVKSDVLTRLR